MKLENQVTNLELSKRLKELGVKQESLFYWKEYDGRWWLDYCGKPWDEFKDRWASAFTVAELGEIIGAETLSIDFVQDDITEADASAEVLIHLIENNILNFEQIIKK
jgi:hypothetical protein